MNSTDLISKALIDSNICHDEFVLINNVLKEFCEMKKKIKNLDIKISIIVSNVGKIQKVKILKVQKQKAEEYCFYQNVKCVIVEIEIS